MKNDEEKRESELREELEFHLEAEAEERMDAGLSPQAARSAAQRDLGNIALIMEDTRITWGRRSLETLRQDSRFAVRWLRKNAGFTVLAVLILGLGVGATTAVFTVINAVLLKPLSYRDADRIVVLQTLWKKIGPGGAHGPNPLASVPDFHDWHDQSSSFEAMAYYVPNENAAITVDSAAEFGNTASVTNEFFKVFGIDPVAGRTFREDEIGPGRSGAALLSYSFAQVHYGSVSGAPGHTIRVGTRILPVIGVMPPGFRYPGTTDVWLPTNTFFPESTQRGGHNVQVIGRLKPPATVEQAQAELTALGDRLEQQYPATNRDKNVWISRLHDNMVKDARLMLVVLLGAAGLVMLVACGNVANLLLAKAGARTREIALRVALGASRKRIVQQLLTESFLLAILAAVVGIFIAKTGSRILIALAPQTVPRLSETAIDIGALAFGFTVSLVSCLLFGLVPALAASKSDVNDVIKQSRTRRSIGGRSRLRRVLVTTEIAFSVILLIGAILLIRSFDALLNVPLGFQTDRVLIMETNIPSSIGIESARQATETYKKLLTGLATIPGVAAVSAVRVPPGVVTSAGSYLADRREFELRPEAPQSVISVVAPGAFAALGIPFKAGRDFNSSDTFDSPFTVIINEQLARDAFPGQDPIGHTIVNGFDSPNPMTIIGVVGDIHQRGPDVAPFAEMYMPFEQHPGPSTALRIVARTNVPPESLFEAFRRTAQAIAPQMPVRFTTMEARFSGIVAAPRFRTILLGIFAGLAVVLAMAGIYAVVSFVVNQRSAEIGLRVALGAAPRDVLKLVLFEGLRMALPGLIFGLAGAVVVTRFFSALLFSVKPTDVATYLATGLLVTVVTFLASYFPAQRAANVDPSAALRQE